MKKVLLLTAFYSITHLACAAEQCNDLLKSTFDAMLKDGSGFPTDGIESPNIPFGYRRDNSGRLFFMEHSKSIEIESHEKLVEKIKSDVYSQVSVRNGKPITINMQGFKQDNAKAILNTIRLDSAQDRKPNLLAFLTRSETDNAKISRILERKYDWEKTEFEWVKSGELILKAPEKNRGDSLMVKITILLGDIAAELYPDLRSLIEHKIKAVLSMPTSNTDEVLNNLRDELNELKANSDIDEIDIKIEASNILLVNNYYRNYIVYYG